MLLDKYQNYQIKYIEKEPLPTICNGCEEDCGSCDNAGLRFYLSEKDSLIMQRKAKAQAIKRLMRELETIDNRLRQMDEQ